jgi:hypothetical protein
MLRLRFVVLFAVFLGCADTLDGVGNVHDLRILGMRAEPPEQLLGDPRPVTVTALIANPPGGFLVGAKWTTCATQDSTTSRCLESSPGYAELDAGMGATVMTGPAGAEPSVTFLPDFALLEQIRQADPYRGLGGIRQVIQVELRAGDERIVGFKRMVFSFPSQPPVALNTNPPIGPIEFNDAGWAPDASVTFTVTPPRTPGQMGMIGAPARNQLAILEDPSLAEDYVVRTFEGETRVLRETFRYNFFASNGTFSPTQAGGANLLSSDAGPIQAQWSRVDTEDAGSGPTTVWIVVRDGRGGESWVSRQAVAP